MFIVFWVNKIHLQFCTLLRFSAALLLCVFAAACGGGSHGTNGGVITVKGTLLSADENPVPFADIASSVAATQTNETGNFELPAAKQDGQITLEFNIPGDESFTSSVNIPVEQDASVLEAVFVADTSSKTVTVVDNNMRTNPTSTRLSSDPIESDKTTSESPTGNQSEQPKDHKKDDKSKPSAPSDPGDKSPPPDDNDPGANNPGGKPPVDPGDTTNPPDSDYPEITVDLVDPLTGGKTPSGMEVTPPPPPPDNGDDEDSGDPPNNNTVPPGNTENRSSNKEPETPSPNAF